MKTRSYNGGTASTDERKKAQAAMRDSMLDELAKTSIGGDEDLRTGEPTPAARMRENMRKQLATGTEA